MKRYKIIKATDSKLVGVIFEYAIINDMKPPKWFQDFEKRITARLDKIEYRLENLVKKNNLVE